MTRVAGIGIFAGVLATAVTGLPGLLRSRKGYPTGDAIALRTGDEAYTSDTAVPKQRLVSLLLNTLAGVAWASLSEVASSRIEQSRHAKSAAGDAATRSRPFEFDDAVAHRDDGRRDRQLSPEALATGLMVLKATLAVAELLRGRRFR